jgi:DNA polymerase-3 subunit gamma/tau
MGKAPLGTGAAQDVDIRKSTDFRKAAIAAPAQDPTAPSAVNSRTPGKPPAQPQAQTAPSAVNSRAPGKPPAQPQAQTAPSAVNSRALGKPPAQAQAQTMPSAVNSRALGKPPAQPQAQTASSAVNSRALGKPPAQAQAQTMPSAVNSRALGKPPAADAAGEDVGHPKDAPFLSRIDSVMASTSTNKRLPNDASAYAIQPQPVQKIHRQRPQSPMPSQVSSQKGRQKSIQTTITSMAAAKPAGFQPRFSSPHGGGGGNQSVWPPAAPAIQVLSCEYLTSNCYREREGKQLCPDWCNLFFLHRCKCD